ncbi:hypothetical protein [uncultured Sphingomonas sp.]|uniref:hypothetical protein n=1 Tax=uncultured Sphingomonas sp. TaxID=158754 RepID=UPI0035C96E23
MAYAQSPTAASNVDPGDESIIILQSLLCLLRERNILTRADLEELSHKVALRASCATDGPLSCCPDAATAASEDLRRITSYLGQRHGGKHARGLG